MLAVEKRVTSVLIEPSSIEKILEVDEHIGIIVFLFFFKIENKLKFLVEFKFNMLL